jgi:hypothetical protein
VYHTAGGQRYGGERREVLVYCAVYDPGANGWVGRCPYRVARSVPRLTVLRDGSVLMTGGFGADGRVAVAERFDPGTLAWWDAGRVPG